MVIFTTTLCISIQVGLFSVTRQLLSAETGIPEIHTLIHYTIGDHTAPVPFSGPAYEALQAVPGMGDLAVWKGPVQLLLQEQDGELPIRGALVNAKFFSVMRIHPALGRFFNEQEDDADGGPSGWSAVLSYEFWVGQYHSDPQAIGKFITIQGVPVRIVGVLPREFIGMTPPTFVAVVLPRHFLAVISPKENRFAIPGYLEWEVFGRLQTGETLQHVQSILQLAEEHVRKAADPTGQMLTSDNFSGLASGHLLSATLGDVTPSYSVRTVKTPLSLMDSLAIALGMLGICNIVLLLVGRNARQSHEIAVRQVLGARPMDLFRLRIEETAFLALAGIAISSPLSWTIARMVSLFVQSFDGLDSFPVVSPEISIFILVAVIFFVANIGSAIATTIWPAQRISSLASKLSGHAVTGKRHAAVVGIEVFASLLLGSCTCMAGGIIYDLLHQESGFGDNQSVIARITFRDSSDEKREQAMQRMIAQLSQYPGVEAVAAMDPMPLSGDVARGDFAVRGSDKAFHSQTNIWPEQVTLNYLRASGTRLLFGRDFAATDLNGPSVCLVGRNLAGRFFGRPDGALDQIILLGGNGLSGQILNPYCRIIGVVEDAHFTSMSKPADMVLYRLSKKGLTSLVVHGYSSGLAAKAIRSVVKNYGPVALTSDIASLQVHVHRDLRLLRDLTRFTALCTLVAQGMMAIGLFGLLAIEVAGRRREIGIRLALGADRKGICAAIYKHYRNAIMAGILFGSMASFVGARLLLHSYVLSPTYWITGYCAGLALTLITIVFGASWPAMRAWRIPPRECLQEN